MLLLLGTLLLAATNSHGVVTSLIVSGTNDPQVNGTYTYDTIVNGKGSWVKGDYVLWWINGGLGYSWNIEKPSTAATYYRNWSDTPLPGETEWGCVAPAASPCTAPVVTMTPLPENLMVSGTVDSFLNGLYTRELNYNGYPQYVMGDYVIRQGFIVMDMIWSIENPTSFNQYYTHADIGVNVPEQGWNLGFAAGSPPSPPVVTETKLPDQYRVSGAGFSGVNGIYTRSINSFMHTGLVYENGGDYFLKAGIFGPMTFGYGITDNGGGSYYYTESNSLLIPASGWSLDFLGISYPPAPSVIPYNFPWPMFLPATTEKSRP